MIPKSMKAAVLTAFGAPEVVKIASRPAPKISGNQVLVRNIATSLNSGDVRIRSKNVPKGFKFLLSLVFGFKKPRKEVLGTVFAGEIVKTGADVTSFSVGDLVFGSTEMGMATHAEYVAIKDSKAIAPIPSGISPSDIESLVFGGSTAVYFLDKLKIEKGERILINAAAGSVGIALVQIAAVLGAEVTAVASAKNHAFLRANGSTHTVDYTTTDLTKLAPKFDVIADCLGTMPYKRHRHLLTKTGRFALISGTMGETLAAPFRNLFGSHAIIGGTSLATKKGLLELVKLIEDGTLRPVVDKEYPFKKITEAHGYVDRGHKRGNVVITF